MFSSEKKTKRKSISVEFFACDNGLENTMMFFRQKEKKKSQESKPKNDCYNFFLTEEDNEMRFLVKCLFV